jgi:hypothetical protein
MGGFMIFDGKEPYTVDPASKELGELLKKGEINITKEEIKDKGRGDALSKGLTLIQTTWFILQCIARKAEHLPITELELVTLAFAALNFMTYAFWWNKPLNVTCPIHIYRKGGDENRVIAEEKGQEKIEVRVTGEGKSEVGTGLIETDTMSGEDETAVWSVIAKDTIKTSKGGATAAMVQTGITIRRLPGVIGHGLKDYVCKYRWHVIWHTLLVPLAPLLALAYVFQISFRLAVGVRAFTFSSHGGYDDDVIEKGAKGVPTFHVGTLTNGEVMVAAFAAMLISTLFGGLHCVAWSFEFPSYIERLLWRIASIAITSAPLTVFTCAIVYMHYSNHRASGFFGPDWLFIILAITLFTAAAVYIISCVILLVLPFMSLRSLPAEAYQTVQWTTFIPHV